MFIFFFRIFDSFAMNFTMFGQKLLSTLTSTVTRCILYWLHTVIITYYNHIYDSWLKFYAFNFYFMRPKRTRYVWRPLLTRFIFPRPQLVVVWENEGWGVTAPTWISIESVKIDFLGYYTPRIYIHTKLHRLYLFFT